VRIPPVAAVQCLPGPVHTRGTPPNVVETDPLTRIRLATGPARPPLWPSPRRARPESWVRAVVRGHLASPGW
jgi:hypothetical protein